MHLNDDRIKIWELSNLIRVWSRAQSAPHKDFRSQKVLINLVESDLGQGLEVSLQLHPDSLADEDIVLVSHQFLADKLHAAPVTEHDLSSVKDLVA